MTTVIHTVGPNDTIDKVRQLILTENIHHVPVVNKKNEFLGIISKVDLELLKHWGTNYELPVAVKQNKDIFSSTLAKEIMKKCVVSVRKDNSLSYCAELFRHNYFHSLPVIENEKLVGIVTTYDLIDFAFCTNKCRAAQSRKKKQLEVVG
ncbi:CBS domain-containing protein [Saprospiraceae bacterium]|nr:CBS domain-containing protein [Saprospiraceae bacterium]